MGMDGWLSGERRCSTIEYNTTKQNKQSINTKLNGVYCEQQHKSKLKAFKSHCAADERPSRAGPF